MASYIITAAQSYVGNGPGTGPGGLFDETEAAASSVTLEAGAFLISTDTTEAIILRGAAAWTVNINGQASGSEGAVYVVDSGAAAKINIGEDGSLRSTNYGALYAQRDVTVVNKGTIHTTGNVAVQLYGTGTNSVTNSGLVAGGFGNAIHFVTGSNNTVTNTGTLLGDILFGGGNNKLVNSGLISNDTEYGAGLTHSNIIFGTGNDTFENKGVINGYVDLGDGLNKTTNAKSITGKDVNGFTILSGNGTDTITNAKGASLAGGINLGNGMNVFTNAGTVGEDNTGASYAGSNDLLAIDTVKNSGTLDGDVNLFAGNDVFTNTGAVNGWIDLGDGNDVFKGGNFSESVTDNAGSDKIALGGGNDTFEAFGGEGDGKDGLMGNPAADEVDGGAGIDGYQTEAIAIRVNLDSVDHTSFGWGGNLSALVLKSTATDSTGTYVDKLKGFENVYGSNSADVIFGSSAANSLYGNGDSDELWGFGGNDFINGGDGVDYIVGGLGADIIYGGTSGGANDRFVYTSIKDSGVTKATRDEIMDFEDIVDEDIDLEAIDAIAATVGDDAFSTLLTGNGTFSAAGQLRVYQTATGWMIEGEVTGDNKADFSIAVRDVDHSISWGLENFQL